MSPQDLDHIEREFSLVLPAAYRQVMAAYPFPADSSAAEFRVLNQVEPLVELNQTYRRGPLLPWAADLLVVGTDGGEEAYVLDTLVDPAPVRVYELETGNLRSCAPDFTTLFGCRLRRWSRSMPYERALATDTATSAGGSSGSVRTHPSASD